MITDLMMPEVDGLQVLKAIKKIAPLTSVIVLTGYGDTQAVIDAMRLGADDFVCKPCEIEELVGRIRRCLEKQKLLHLLAAQKLQLEQRVRERTSELNESNIALTVLLKKREGDRKILGDQVLANTVHLIAPYLNQFKDSGLTKPQQALVGIIQANLEELTSPFANRLSADMFRLTPVEIQIANLIKLGKRTKEIANIFNLSSGTISTYRKNIRKKLEMTNQKSNLQTALANCS